MQNMPPPFFDNQNKVETLVLFKRIALNKNSQVTERKRSWCWCIHSELKMTIKISQEGNPQ